MKLALAVILASGAAHADTLIASEHDGTLVVSRLAGDKLETAYEEPHSGALEYAFSDAHTLWVLRAKAGKFTIAKIVDGKPDTERVLLRSEWDPSGKAAQYTPRLIVNGDGVWVRRCVNQDLNECTEVWLRVDAKAPLKIDEARGMWFGGRNYDSPLKAIAAPPKGYAFKVPDSGHSFTCTGPKSRLAFAAGTRDVRGVRWVWAEPAIATFTVTIPQAGKPTPHFEPFDEAYDESAPDGLGVFYLEDCKTYLNDVVIVAPDVVATTEGDRAWKLRRGTQVLATFTASRVVAAPF